MHASVMRIGLLIFYTLWSAHHRNVMWIYCALRGPPEKTWETWSVTELTPQRDRLDT